MGRSWRKEGAETAKPIWRVPGLNIVRARSWVPVTVQEVESAGGQGVWRSDKHRLSPLMSEAAQFAVQFDSGPAREFRGPGPRLFFLSCGRHDAGPQRPDALDPGGARARIMASQRR